LTYKCKLYGSKLVVVDRWFPSSKTCVRFVQSKPWKRGMTGFSGVIL